MANSDLLANLLLSLTQKADPDTTTNDNTLIQKSMSVNENVQTTDVFNISKPKTSNFVWGGTGFNAGWVWNQGQYAGYGNKSISKLLSDYVTSADNSTFTYAALSSLQWGGTGITTGWIWNGGQWR